MTTKTVHHLGGYLPDAPAGNRAEEWDVGAGTYTRWDEAGQVIETRTLTVEEVAAFAAEAAEALAETNERTIEDRARAALTANAAFLAIASPTNAQTLAQVRRLTKECSVLIRLAVRELDNIGDTE